MVTLILLVCLSAAPDTCREERPPSDAESNLSCMLEGQLIAAAWLEEHPKWTLRAWRCRLGPAEKST